VFDFAGKAIWSERFSVLSTLKIDVEDFQAEIGNRPTLSLSFAFFSTMFFAAFYSSRECAPSLMTAD